MKNPFPTIDLTAWFDDLLEGFLRSMLGNRQEKVALPKTCDALLPKLLSGEFQVEEVEVVVGEKV